MICTCCRCSSEVESVEGGSAITLVVQDSIQQFQAYWEMTHTHHMAEAVRFEWQGEAGL